MHKDDKNTNAENKYRRDTHQTKENDRETYNLTNNIWRRPQHIQFRRAFLRLRLRGYANDEKTANQYWDQLFMKWLWEKSC